MSDQTNESAGKALEKMSALLTDLKSQRAQYLSGKMNTVQYSSKSEGVLSDLAETLQEYHRIYLPFSIPAQLMLPAEPPKWISKDGQMISQFKKIAEDSAECQENLIVNFRRPGMRRKAIERAAALLSIEQKKQFWTYRWKQLTLLLSTLTQVLRPKITAAQSAPKETVKDLNEYIESQSVSIPDRRSDLQLFLLEVFSEGSPLDGGIPSKSIEDEISVVSSVIAAVAPALLAKDIVDCVTPFIASIHISDILEKMKSAASFPISKLQEAIQLVGETVGMEDFGYTGEVSEELVNAIGLASSSEDVTEMSDAFLKAAVISLKASDGPVEAGARLAVAIIRSRVELLPAYFYSAIAWSSKDTLDRFALSPMILLAIDCVIQLVPDF